MPFQLDSRHTTWAARLTEIVRTVVAQASESAGVGRKAIAFRMGRSEECIGSWLEPKQMRSIPGGALFELMCREDLLPQDQRDALWTKLAREAGYTVVREDAARAEETPPVVQLAEISEAVGKLSSTVLASMRAKSAGGHQITTAEAAAILDQAMSVNEELRQLIETVKKAKGGRK